MKRVLITGGSSGLGLALAQSFLALGYEVHTLSRRGESAPGTVNYRVDLSDAQAIRAFTHTFCAKSTRLDLLINNAGISPSGLIPSFSERDFDETLCVNFTAARLLVEELRPILKAGTIINIVSRVGKEGRAGLCAYAASKGLLLEYTKMQAPRLRSEGIKILAINPGFMVTAMVTEKSIQKQRRESLLGANSSPERTAGFIAWIAGQSFGSGELYDFDSRVYKSWN
jgi:NAD(P)-dependent dehydrogenase (short-subunit alcohol dehydrogenase family)